MGIRSGQDHFEPGPFAIFYEELFRTVSQDPLDWGQFSPSIKVPYSTAGQQVLEPVDPVNKTQLVPQDMPNFQANTKNLPIPEPPPAVHAESAAQSREQGIPASARMGNKQNGRQG